MEVRRGDGSGRAPGGRNPRRGRPPNLVVALAVVGVFIVGGVGGQDEFGLSGLNFQDASVDVVGGGLSPSLPKTGSSKKKPETIYVDKQLLMDLGDWLSNLKEKQLNRIMAMLRRRQKQKLGKPRPPPTALNFQKATNLDWKQQRQNKNAFGGVNSYRQQLMRQRNEEEAGGAGGREYGPWQREASKRPFSLLRQRTLGKYQGNWQAPPEPPPPQRRESPVEISLDDLDLDLGQEPALKPTNANLRQQIPAPTSSETALRLPGRTEPMSPPSQEQPRQHVAMRSEPIGMRSFRRRRGPLSVWDFSLI